MLLPEWRGRRIGWRAQAMLCDYLFGHTPAQRIQAGTHPENIAEQKSLEKAGFTLEGVVRARVPGRAVARRVPLQPAARRPVAAMTARRAPGRSAGPAFGVVAAPDAHAFGVPDAGRLVERD